MPLRLVYFGLPLAAYLLHRDGHEIALAVLSPIEAPGRRRLLARIGSERVLDAAASGPDFAGDVLERVRAASPDLVVSWFWTRLLPAAVLEAARLGAIGAHPSLLPKYRGPNPYFAAIDQGETETGVTIHRLTPRYDDGDILLTARIPVGNRDSWQLARALDRPSLALLREAVARFASSEPFEGVPQADALATFAPEPSDEETRVDFRWPLERVLRRVRALSPVPGVVLDVEGIPLVVLRGRRADAFPQALAPGEGAVFGNPPAFVLRTADGAIAVERGILDTAESEPSRALDGVELANALAAHLAGRRAQTTPL